MNITTFLGITLGVATLLPGLALKGASISALLNPAAILNAFPSLRPERFSAIGYGQYRPLLPNITPENRARNRRVEILIVRNFLKADETPGTAVPK